MGLRKQLTKLKKFMFHSVVSNNTGSRNDKTGMLPSSLLDSTGFTSFIAEADTVDYNSLCVLLEPEVEKKEAKSLFSPLRVPTACHKAGWPENF